MAVGTAADTLKSLWIKNKRATVIAGAGIVAVIVTLSFVFGGEDTARESSAPTPQVIRKAPPQPSAPVSPTPARPASPAEEPPPETVTLTINGLPERTVIEIDDEKVTSPVTLPYAKEPVEITFMRRGFKTLVTSFVPEKDTILDISMEKRERPVKRVGNRKTKKDASKPKTPSNNLADNPFGV